MSHALLDAASENGHAAEAEAETATATEVAPEIKVYVVQPRYGDVTQGAAFGRLCPSKDPRVKFMGHGDVCSSSTPHAFNRLLAHVLNLRDAGEVTHLAMIHSDITPEFYWVDTLWSEMKDQNADMISVVIPIKEPERLRTSTAMGDAEDIWRPARYVTMRHRGLIPDTFGPEHVCQPGEVLLLNTGLFLADLRRPWWDEPVEGGDVFAFQFRNRIVRTEDGYRAQFLPEDWLLSRAVQRHGGRCVATWKVEAIHHGYAEWSNQAGSEVMRGS